MNVLMAQARLKADGVPEVRTAAKKMFAAIEEAQPEGIRYAWVVLGDGETFAALVQVEDGVENTIPSLPEFQELQQGLAERLAEPATTQALEVIGSYRLF
jgi:hypothetical protein